MNLQEDISRIKQVMGLHESMKKCLPKSYKNGDKYGRDELASMFSCLTGEPKKFPVTAVREWLFPLLPDGSFRPQDPMRLNFGQPYTFTLEQMAKVENRDTRNVTVGIKTIDPNQFADRTQRWFEMKMKAPFFQQRLEYQMNKIRENGFDTTVVTPENEPIVFESVGGKLYLQEGWHRVMAILELLKKGEITPDQAKVFMVVVYRVPSYRMNIIEKPPGLFENMRNYE
jgi:hypothetical protein